MQADYRDKAHKNKLKKAILLDVDYVYNKKFDAGFISLLLKTQNGIIRRFYKFDPYFLVDTKEIERGLRLLKSQNIDASAEKTERIINNEKKQLWKIITKKPSLIPKAKKILEAGLENASFYEYDIPIKKRFMIDYGIEPFNEIYYKLKDKRLIEEIKNQKEAKPHFKLMSFDIEVYNPQGVPNPDKDNIIIISYKKDDKASAISTSHAKNSAFAKDEKELLLKFDELIKEEKPDIIFGYNSSLFDFPYIEKRAKKLKIKLQLLKKSKRISKGLIKGYKLRRHIHLDLYHIARLLNIMGIIEAERLTLADLYKSLFAKDKY
ncbi:MAG: 3'-5' exonuclease, partial [Candidatus Anstonellales archaeon]